MKVPQVELKFSWLLTLGVLMLLAVAVFAANGARPAQAAGSVNVALVGSPDCIPASPNSGPDSGLPTSPAAFSGFNFTNVAPGALTPSYFLFGNFDTVVLVVCSPAMNCDADTLSAGAKGGLMNFVGLGGKLIIYDGECGDGDYSWLPAGYRMTTGYTPGPTPLTGQGPIVVAENNILSSNTASGVYGPYYIDAAGMSQYSEVDHASYMKTHESKWCLDMSATKVVPGNPPFEGWVHAYARYGSGLMIYNGLDLDAFLPGGVSGGNWQPGNEASPPAPYGVLKIWLQELNAPHSPTSQELQCGVPAEPGSSIKICKETDPNGDPTVFGFSGGYPDLQDSFTLTDNNCFTVDPASLDSWSFTELPPPGWELWNIICTGGANVTIGPNPLNRYFDQGDTEVGINLGQNEDVTCTFFNCLMTIDRNGDTVLDKCNVVTDSPVGGIVELPAEPQAPLAAASGSALPPVPLAAGAGAALAMLAAGIWYGRRRWLR